MSAHNLLTANDVFQAQQARLNLKWLAGQAGRERRLEPATARYPGMALVGYLNFIHPNRVQVLGAREMAYLDGFAPAERRKLLAELFACATCAMVIITRTDPVPVDLIEHANRESVPLIVSSTPGPQLIDSLQYYLSRALAEHTTLHGVFLEVMGIGVLLSGESGIGKSEVALELLSRSQRLIADDAVEIRRVGPDVLVGRCPEAVKDFMEVRGLGILNVRAMFGETAVRNEHTLDLFIRFEQMTKERMEAMDRLQEEQQARWVLNVNVPEVVLLVAPGRNLAVLVEAAARRHIQQRRGLDPLRDLMEQQSAIMEHLPIPDKKEPSSKGDE